MAGCIGRRSGFDHLGRMPAVGCIGSANRVAQGPHPGQHSCFVVHRQCRTPLGIHGGAFLHRCVGPHGHHVCLYLGQFLLAQDTGENIKAVLGVGFEYFGMHRAVLSVADGTAIRQRQRTLGALLQIFRHGRLMLAIVARLCRIDLLTHPLTLLAWPVQQKPLRALLWPPQRFQRVPVH